MWAMIDEGETDWKVLVIDVTDPHAAHINSVAELESFYPGTVKKTFEFLRYAAARASFCFATLVLMRVASQRLQDPRRQRPESFRLQRRAEERAVRARRHRGCVVAVVLVAVCGVFSTIIAG